MSRTNRNQVFNRQGAVISETTSVVSDRDDLADGSYLRLNQAYSALRQWSVDAQTAYTDWPNKTAADKDAVQRETIRRLGVFFDRFADYLMTVGLDR